MGNNARPEKLCISAQRCDHHRGSSPPRIQRWGDSGDHRRRIPGPRRTPGSVWSGRPLSGDQQSPVSGNSGEASCPLRRARVPVRSLALPKSASTSWWRWRTPPGGLAKGAGEGRIDRTPTRSRAPWASASAWRKPPRRQPASDGTFSSVRLDSQSPAWGSFVRSFSTGVEISIGPRR